MSRIMNDLKRFDIPVYKFGKGVPVTAVTAGIHGEEQTGVYTAERIIDFLSSAKVKGTVIVIPVCNPGAFQWKKRMSPFDNNDLNRCFCQNQPSRSSSLADRIWDITRKAAYLLDLHCCGIYGSLYVMSMHNSYPHQIEMAGSLGIPNVIQSSEAPGQLFVHTNLSGRKSLLIEMPGGQPAASIDFPAAETVYQASLRFLNFTGNIQCDTEKPSRIRLHGKIFRRLAETPGLFIPSVKPGVRLKKDSVIGTMNDQLCLMPWDGTVLAVSPGGYMFEQDRLFTCAPFTEIPKGV